MIEIGSVVSEIWPDNVKVGDAFIGRRVYSAKYSIKIAVLNTHINPQLIEFSQT